MTTISTNRRSAMGLFGASLFATGMAAPALAQNRTGGDLGAAVNAAHNRHQGFAEGKNADYIPALAAVPSTYFGVAAIGSDGAVHDAGDTDQLFSIQSICKVFTMALVMKESASRSFSTVSVSTPPAACSTPSRRSNSTAARR